MCLRCEKPNHARNGCSSTISEGNARLDNVPKDSQQALIQLEPWQSRCCIMYNTLKTHCVDIHLDPKIRRDLDTGSTAIDIFAETIQKEIEEGSMIDGNHVDKVGFLYHIHTRITALGSRPGPSLYWRYALVMMVVQKLGPLFDRTSDIGGVCRDLDEQLLSILQEGAHTEAGLPIAQAKTILKVNKMKLFYPDPWAYTDVIT